LSIGGLFGSWAGVANAYNAAQLFGRYRTEYPEFLAPKSEDSTLERVSSTILRYGIWGVYGGGLLALKLSAYTVAWPIAAYAIVQDAKRGPPRFGPGPTDSHFCPGRSAYFLQREYDTLARQGKLLLPFTRLH
jgi:hypothetical protein